MKILGIQKTTLLDFPGHVATTLFTGGCNFRCPFCHNASFVLSPDLEEACDEEEILSFLRKRSNVLEGVCITGGEPTLQPDLAPFMEKIHNIGYFIKLDTNGYRPDILKELFTKNLIDFCAMDIKSSFDKYTDLTGLSYIDTSKIMDSVNLIRNSGKPYEFRTTVVMELHRFEDLWAIANTLSPSDPYILQSYVESDTVICPGFHPYPPEIMQEFLCKIKSLLPKATLRGISL